MAARRVVHIGCADGQTISVRPSRRSVIMEIDGAEREISAEAWLRLRSVVDSAIKAPGHGHDTAAVPPNSEPERASGRASGPSGNRHRKRRHHGIAVRDLLDEGLLEPGAALVFDGLPDDGLSEPPTGRVNHNGDIDYDGDPHPTPSAAAATASGGRTMNGWDVWLHAGKPISTLRDELIRRRQQRAAQR